MLSLDGSQTYKRWVLIRPKLLLKTNRKLHICFQLAPRLDDHELLRSNFLGIVRNFAFSDEQMFVVDGVTVKHASEG